jgi:hypothetical protein
MRTLRVTQLEMEVGDRHHRRNKWGRCKGLVEDKEGETAGETSGGPSGDNSGVSNGDVAWDYMT